MKKEKKELTLEQLKRVRKNAAIIVLSIYFICFIMAMIVIVVDKFVKIKLDILVVGFLLVSFITLGVWMLFVDLELVGKIRDQEYRLKIDEIKNKAKEGELKNVIALKSEDMKNKVLSTNLEKILFIGKVNETLILEIYLKNGFFMPINIQEKELLDILSQKTKDTILDKVIDSITIEDLEKSTMQVKIETKGDTIKQRADDYNLLGWFELKE